ncbi:hypothetical protein BRD09_06960 [Halobacteriales archaeon SW_10_68_16]|nr:MAG: hypothetical protein BRD09_06960 [Halobacteriales archaeon SW_10_68_16]
MAPDGLVYEDDDGTRQISEPIVVAATETGVVYLRRRSVACRNDVELGAEAIANGDAAEE